MIDLNKYLLSNGKYPNIRMRRTRQDEWARKLLSENYLSVNNLILPIFITYKKSSSYIKTMPNVKRHSIDDVLKTVKKAKEAGIQAIALFPETSDSLKDNIGSEASNPENLVCQTIKKIKKSIKNIGIISDVALDPYTKSGHDGIVTKGIVDNDKTLEILCKQALSCAQAGCDIIAPSDMMDGRVGKIRSYLDKHGFENVMILSYAAKYNSGFYEPFRDAIKSNKKLGKYGKSSYQMNPINGNEALKEVSLDLEEGADIIMIKPGMPYLDIIDRERIIIESLNCFIRAGADGVLTYFALDAANILNK